MSAFTVALAALVSTAYATSKTSPILAWSSSSDAFRNTDDIRSGVTLDVAQVLSQHVSVPKNGATVIFVQDKLTLEDLAQNGGVYGDASVAIPNIKAAMTTAKSSLFVPAASSKTGVIDSLTSKMSGGQHTVVTDAQDFLTKRVSISAANNTVFIVNLPDVSGTYDEFGALNKNDQLVGDIIEYLSHFEAPVSAFVVSNGFARVSDIGGIRRRRDTGTSGASVGATAQRGGACNSPSCRTARRVGFPQESIFMSTTVLMGIIVVLFLVAIFITGVFGLMVLQNNDKFPDANDEHLIISTRNE